MLEPESNGERLSFMQLGSNAQRDLRAIKPIIMRELPDAMDQFYGQIQAFPQTADIWKAC